MFSRQDNEKRTPLHAAAYLGDAEIIELLILSGKTTTQPLIFQSFQPSIQFHFHTNINSIVSPEELTHPTTLAV